MDAALPSLQTILMSLAEEQLTSDVSNAPLMLLIEGQLTSDGSTSDPLSPAIVCACCEDASFRKTCRFTCFRICKI